jgi:type IV secretory pathway VirB4 component
MPTLSDVYTMLDRMRRASRDQMFQQKVVPLIAALENYVGQGQYAGLFDAKSTVDLDNLFTVFHVGDVGDKMMPGVMHLVLEFLRTTLFTAAQQESKQPKLIYVDEAHRLLQHVESAYFLGWTATTCRKYGVGLTVMTQHIGSFLNNTDGSENKIGRDVLGSCSLTVLLRQHPNEIDAVREAFKLSERELTRLRNAQSGEGLLVLDQESSWFTAQYVATDSEKRLLSTTALERAQFAEEDRYGLPPGVDGYTDEDDEQYGGAPFGRQTPPMMGSGGAGATPDDGDDQGSSFFG